MADAQRAERLSRRARQVARQLGAPRLIVTSVFLVLALLVARYSWHIPLAVSAERALFDIRAAVTAPRVDQDPRIVMVVYTDETLAATAKRSPVDRTILAHALTALDAMGAKAIGIDVLIDQPQPEDATLITAFRNMKTPTFLAFASNVTNKANIQGWQEAFLTRFQHSIATPAVHPTSVFFQPDSDGTMRSWPPQPRKLPPLLSNAMTGKTASRDYQRSIGYRLPRSADRPVFAKFPIDLFANPDIAAAVKPQIEGRYVLIGGDIIDQDQFTTPLTWYVNDSALEDRDRNGSMIGLEVHAHMLAQLLDGRWFAALPRWANWVCSLLVVLTGALSALSGVRAGVVALMMAGQLAFYVALPFGLQKIGVDTQSLPAFGWGVGWFVAFAAVGSAVRAVGSEQRRFAQSALGKYLPRDIAAEIMRDPDSLALHGEKREIFVVFTDLEGFTKLSHAIEPELVATLLNRYLDMLSAVVLEHGGTIDKFVGDAVVAFWGAPIARPDDGERAARAALAMWQAGEEFRANVPDGVPAIGKTRVGLHHGDAIVGNFGGEGRIQYTALGDSMNTASRLESANKQLDTSVLVSKEAAELSGLDWYRPLGRVVLRGRATPIDVMEPRPDLTREARAVAAQVI
ncbi:MAG: adenylate/guanylate cyclase domain-containing protein, partial [Sphingomonadaceae bacterium]|nr:adenylate/guanylate cyclase domain-containing protein [Sphingomonadaceae bacterium]